MKGLIKAIIFGTAMVVGMVMANFFRMNETVSAPAAPTATIALPQINPLQTVKIQSNEQTGPRVVQSKTITFPKIGGVIVQAIEEDGKFPVMRFVSKATGKTLLESSIADHDEMLLHEVDGLDSFPQLRFRTVESAGLPSPLIMSVGIFHGGSDNGYYLTVFAEIDGKLHRLNEEPYSTAIQGGFFIGDLNKRFGAGLVVWGFIWGHGTDESHYSYHRYDVQVYKIRGTRLVQTISRETKKMYSPSRAANCLREFGIAGRDQRIGIPIIGESVEADL